MKQLNHGFTLIELIATLTIAAILIGVAIPAFTDFLNNTKIKSQTLTLRATLHFARESAVNQTKTVTVCPTLKGEQCHKNWSHSYMAFIDENENRQFDANDTVLSVKQVSDPNIKLRWRAFRKKTSLQWLDTGITNQQNGSFEYCYQNNPKYARALVISKSGRIRVSKDKNNDGIHENARGKNLTC